MWTSAHCIDGILVRSWCYHSPSRVIWYPRTHRAKQNRMFQTSVTAESLESKEDKHKVVPGWNQPTAFIAHSCLVLLWPHPGWCLCSAENTLSCSFTFHPVKAWDHYIYQTPFNSGTYIIFFHLFFFLFLSSVTMPATCFKIFILANYK